jgi:hypothetical protein
MAQPLKVVHMGLQPKMIQTRWRTMSPLLHPLIMRRSARFRHLSALSIHLGRRQGPLYTRGLHDTAKYRPTWVLGGVGSKNRQQWDVALGAYAPLAPTTRVGIYPIAA